MVVFLVEVHVLQYLASLLLPGLQVLWDQLIYPYIDGMMFVFAVARERGWDGVDAVYFDAPVSSEQVLHPERYLDRDEDVSAFSAEPDAYLATARGIVLDHGEPEPIVSAHLLKTFSAVRALRAAGHEPPALIPGLRRFFETPLPRRHVRRSARQALAFVAKEG